MAYNKKIWTNRTSEYPNRYRMTSVNGNIADVAIVPNEGNVTAEGDKFCADTMNNLETRIKNGFDSADSSISTLNTTLRGLISSEQTRATGVETLIQADVDALESNLASEVSRAKGAETTLANNLASEVTRATGVENGHNTRITSLEGRMDNAESDIGTLESAIAGFQTSLDTEVTRATGAESTLTTNLQAETTRATNAENVLDTRVTTLETITTRAYKASGSVYFADLPSAVESRQGNIYDILDAFTTTNEFLEGPGKEYPAHTDVVIVGVEGDYYNEVTPSGEENPSEEGWYVYDSTEEEYVLTQDTSVQSGTTYYSYANVKYMYNIGIGFFDTSNFVQKTDYATLLAAGIVKPDGTTTSIDADGTIHSLGGGQGTAEAAERMIAPIEADASASIRAYTIGQRLILNNILYKAKTAIVVGDALVVGTNIENSDDVSTQIDDANAELQKSYKTDDTASTTINDTDYVPMSASDGTKKKTLWSTIVAKIKTALATVATSGSYTDLTDKPTINFSGTTFYSGNRTVGEHDANNMVNNGNYYYTSNGPATSLGALSTDGALYVQSYSDTWVAQMAQDYRNGNLFVRGKNNGSWSAWKKPNSGEADVASNVYTPRSTSGDYNSDLPGAAKTKIVEHGPSSPNRPASYWFYVVTMQGGDTAYATQVAYGMTTNSNYCRRMVGGTWGAWQAFRNPTGNATAAQVLSGYTFSNASSDGLTGNIPSRDPRSTYPAVQTGHNGTGSYVYIPYGYYQPNETVDNTKSTWFYLTNAQAQNMHKHTATWTPSSSQYNSSQAEIAEFHSYRYVNTAVCYTRGSQHYANNRSGFASGIFKDANAEYRMDLYDILSGTTLRITTDATDRCVIIIKTLSGTPLATQAYFDKDHPLQYTFTSDYGIQIIIKRTSAYNTNGYYYWWYLSNSNY